MSVVVLGATGQLGRTVVEALLDRGTSPGDVVAVGRATGRLSAFADRGVRVAELDYDDVPDHVDWLAHGDTVLLISGSEVGRRVSQHEAAIDLAVRSGVARIVYTSAPSASDTELVLAPEHAVTEQRLAQSGLPFTVLRNGWYTENYEQAFAQARATGTVTASLGEGRIASAPRSDYGDAAAVVLTTEGHEGSIYELSGDVAWSFHELAAVFADVLGRDVSYQALTPEEHVAALTGNGLDQGTAGFVVALDRNAAQGLLGVTTGELAELIGRPTVPLAETVRTWI